MSNYILSYDLHKATDKNRLDFENELMKFGWTVWEKRTSDKVICRLPNTTMLIKNKTDAQVVQSVKAAEINAQLAKNGASVSKWIISEYRSVHFESDEPLDRKGGKSGQLLRSLVEQDMLS